MTDSPATLTVDSKGFVFFNGAPLPVRYMAGSLEFVVKRPADRIRLKCKRVKIPLDDFKKLEQAGASPVRRRPAGRMPRTR